MNPPSINPGFGVGMDLSWETQGGSFAYAGGKHVPNDDLKGFFKRYGDQFDYFFFSLQPKDFDLLINPRRIDDYFATYDELIRLLPGDAPRVALHHTFLSLGSLDRALPRERIAGFTNALIDRYGFEWVNEDLGIWSLGRKMLPYPMPPLLNQAGLDACVENIRFYRERLHCPLFVEFPGFSEGSNFFMGKLNAFDFFKEAISRSGAECVLDTGHILSYQWLLGNRGDRMLEGLEDALPYDRCREIHVSGCSIVENRFVDFHHGIIQDEQLVLLDYLLKRCHGLKGVTYEDPRFSTGGELIPKSQPNFNRLRNRVRDGAGHGASHG